MKINFNVGLKNLEGKVLKDKEKDVTLKDVSTNALLGNYQDEKIDGEEKLKRFLLSLRINQLPMEDIVHFMNTLAKI